MKPTERTELSLENDNADVAVERPRNLDITLDTGTDAGRNPTDAIGGGLNHADRLRSRIENRTATIAVVGLGYVGFPVALAFAEAGFQVVGFDVDRDKVADIQKGGSYLGDVDPARVAAQRGASRLHATHRAQDLSRADVILIAVPTPLSNGTPDLSLVEAAGRTIRDEMASGALIILESTTYPGTTEDLLRPLLEQSGAVGGSDFFLAFSPERIDPGNPVYSFEDIPKIVGGISEESTALAKAIYATVVPEVVTVSSPKEAELAKVIENTFRHVNIALVNELAIYAHDMGIDIWESIAAASTKPFGFMPFWPSAGWGGHCIPLDPAYLSWCVKRDRGYGVRFVELANEINSEMPRHVVERVSSILNDQGKAVRGAKVLLVGLAYKAGTEDTRGSAGLKAIEGLEKRGACVFYHDPLVSELMIGERRMRSSTITDDVLALTDMVVILVPQEGVDWDQVKNSGVAVLDCCNALGVTSPAISRL